MLENIRNQQLAVGATSVLLSTARNRSELIITNSSTGGEIITIALGNEATANAGIVLTPYSVYYASASQGFNVWNGEIYAICSGAGGLVSVFER